MNTIIIIVTAVVISGIAGYTGWKALAKYQINCATTWNRAYVRRMAGVASEKELQLLKGKRPKPSKFVKTSNKPHKSFKQTRAEWVENIKGRVERLHPLYAVRQQLSGLEEQVKDAKQDGRWASSRMYDIERDIKDIRNHIEQKVVHKPVPKPKPKKKVEDPGLSKYKDQTPVSLFE